MSKQTRWQGSGVDEMRRRRFDPSQITLTAEEEALAAGAVEALDAVLADGSGQRTEEMGRVTSEMMSAQLMGLVVQDGQCSDDELVQKLLDDAGGTGEMCLDSDPEAMEVGLAVMESVMAGPDSDFIPKDDEVE